MSAKVLRTGLSTVGFDAQGELQAADVAAILAEIPGQHGDVCFVVIGKDFCWVRGLPKGRGFEMSKHPLNGPKETWQQQIEDYASMDAAAMMKATGTTHHAVGTKLNLAQPNMVLVSE